MDTSNLVWPAPPDEPRIRFVAEYRGLNDLVPQSKLKALLLGDDGFGAALRKPYGVTVSADGQRIYVTEPSYASVMVFDLKAKTFSPFYTDAQSRLISPIEARLDAAGNLYVTDSIQGTVNVYTPEGKTLLSVGKEQKLVRPTGLAVDSSGGRFYVADTKSHRIVVYSLDGKFLTSFGVRGSEPGQFNYPVNLALDAKGNLHVVDSGNFRVQVLAPDGSYLHSFGTPGDLPGSMARPKGIAVDSEGHIYVADAAFNNFQIFEGDGAVRLFVGSMGREPGKFWLPNGMYIDSRDRIYVVDAVNARIQVFQYLKSSKAAQSAPAG